jgi:hypothetical protein
MGEGGGVLTAVGNGDETDEDGPHEDEGDGKARNVRSRPAPIILQNIIPVSLHDIVCDRWY